MVRAFGFSMLCAATVIGCSSRSSARPGPNRSVVDEGEQKGDRKLEDATVPNARAIEDAAPSAAGSGKLNPDAALSTGAGSNQPRPKFPACRSDRDCRGTTACVPAGFEAVRGGTPAAIDANKKAWRDFTQRIAKLPRCRFDSDCENGWCIRLYGGRTYCSDRLGNCEPPSP